MACAKGNCDIVKILLDKGASVNHVSKLGSPLIYASEVNNVELVRLLLARGADLNAAPQQLRGVAAPVFEACLQAHPEVACVLMGDPGANLTPEQKVCFLSLLGVQCVGKLEDVENGVNYWKQSLQQFQDLPSTRSLPPDERPHHLQRLYMCESPKSAYGLGRDCAPSTASEHFVQSMKQLATTESIRSTKPCCTAAELDSLALNSNSLMLQAMLVLESILGPSHSMTIEMVSKATRMALENGDLGQACKVFLYIIQSNEACNHTGTAIEYLSQMADLFLNIFESASDNLRLIENFPVLLLAAIQSTYEAVNRVITQDGRDCGLDAMSMFVFSTRLRMHSMVVKTVEELVEIFMSFLRVFVEQDSTDAQQTSVKRIIKALLGVSRFGSTRYPGYCIELELLKVAGYSGTSAKSTLYFFQGEIFPCIKILELLLKCGADPNCRDHHGNTALHFCLDDPSPARDAVKLFLDYGADVDVMNITGITPFDSIRKLPHLGIDPFRYQTLKCLAARAVMLYNLEYRDQVPRSLEPFLKLHGLSKAPKLT